MKKLVLEDIHVSLGGKMVPFAGFNMPVQYEGVNAEHLTVREGVGVFDVSHMGEFFVSGPSAQALLQYVTSNDVSKLVDGQVQYSCFPNDKGGIVDDLLVYRFNSEKYLIVVNASNIEKDWNWIVQHNERFGAELVNKSDEYSLFAIQGPKAIEAVQGLTSIDVKALKYYNFKEGDFAGQEGIIVSATGYTGAGGLEIYVPNDKAVEVWKQIFSAGEEFGIKPIGLAARDTLRLEMGYCLYGNDINDETSPIEAGLSWITKFSKDFVNKDQLAAQIEAGVSKKLVGFELVDRGIPRKDYAILNSEGDEIGVVTSGTMSPSYKKAIGMGYVNTKHLASNESIYIQVRAKQLKAKVVKLPLKS